MIPLDFHMLAGLSFEGQSIFVDRRRVVAAMGRQFPLAAGNSIRMEHLKAYIQYWQQTNVLTPLKVRQRACCFLLFMLGQCLVANGAGAVHLWWLHYFRDFLTIERMNWASLGLVTLYHSMNLFSRGIYESHVDFSYLWEVYNFILHFILPHNAFRIPEKSKINYCLHVFLYFKFGFWPISMEGVFGRR